MTTVGSKYRGSKEYHLVFCRLIAAARNRGTATYQELGKLLGLPLRGSHLGREIGQILGEISEDEHRDGRPMLSAVAVRTSGRPGDGFFALARELGRLDGDASAKELRHFWEQERDLVYATWKEEHGTYAAR